MQLNDLQIDIIKRVINEQTNEQIAEDMNYSIEYIKKNLRHCFKYFKVKTRVGLAREAIFLLYGELNG